LGLKRKHCEEEDSGNGRSRNGRRGGMDDEKEKDIFSIFHKYEIAWRCREKNH